MDHEKVISEARQWVGTPYHPVAKLKGVGCDCLTFIAGVYENVGLIPPVKIPHYAPDWHLHQAGEKYYEGVLDYCDEVEEPQPGDIALWKFGRCYSHGAIVIKWPAIIHSVMGMGVTEGDADRDQWLKYIGDRTQNLRPVKYFRYRGK